MRVATWMSHEGHEPRSIKVITHETLYAALYDLIYIVFLELVYP